MDYDNSLLVWGGLIAMAIAVIGLAVCCDNDREKDCHRAGGEYVRLYKSSICVKPGSVIEP